MLSDLRLAWRRLRHAPGFAAIFTVADAVLFRPLPYRDPDRLFLLRQVDPATGLRSTGVPLPTWTPPCRSVPALRSVPSRHRG